jgi:hypothetical protein
VGESDEDRQDLWEWKRRRGLRSTQGTDLR